jgi:hypothetical protein
MQQPDPHVEKSFALDCSCGEKMVIFGNVKDWLPRNPIFRCNCGERYTFSDRVKEEYYASLVAS